MLVHCGRLRRPNRSRLKPNISIVSRSRRPGPPVLLLPWDDLVIAVTPTTPISRFPHRIPNPRTLPAPSTGDEDDHTGPPPGRPRRDGDRPIRRHQEPAPRRGLDTPRGRFPGRRPPQSRLRTRVTNGQGIAGSRQSQPQWKPHSPTTQDPRPGGRQTSPGQRGGPAAETEPGLSSAATPSSPASSPCVPLSTTTATWRLVPGVLLRTVTGFPRRSRAGHAASPSPPSAVPGEVDPGHPRSTLSCRSGPR